MQRGYAGIHVRAGVHQFDPRLPEAVGDLSFSMRFRGTLIYVYLAGGQLAIAVDREAMSRPIRIEVDGEVRELRPGDRTTFKMAARSAQTGHD